MILFYIFIILWVVISVKQILFWVYLWQLKEYHIPRFVDHFRTAKGRELLFNKLRIIKMVLFFFAFLPFFFWVVLVLYFVETIIFLKQIILKSAKKPKFTKKSAFLVAVCMVAVALILLVSENLSDLLIFDIIMPIIVSGIVLCFQPFVVWARKRILAKASQVISQNPRLTVIGITGSYGKTTTKEFLTTILQSKFKVLSTQEHKNSEMGIAQTILKDLKLEHKIFVVEMGAYKKGGIKLLCDIVNPRFGIVTGVTVQHLSLFGSMENLLSAEGGYELARALPSGGTLFLNADNNYCLDLFKKLNTYGKINKKLYAENGNKLNAKIWAENVEVLPNSLSFVALTRDKQMAHFKVNVLGRHNLQNLLGAILIAKELDMSLEEISKAAESIKPEQAGIVAKQGVHGINIIDSSYSSNPDGAVADLETLKLFSGKRIVVMPCLIELGKESKNMHQKIGKKIVEVCDLAIITTKDKFDDLKIGAGDKADKIIFMENSQDIFNKITTELKDNDAVLLEGRVPAKLTKLLSNEK